MKFKIVNLFLSVWILTLLCLASCKEDMEEQTFEPERMFMPTGDIQSAGSETSVKLTWKESLYADPANTSYTVEVSPDSLFLISSFLYTATTDTAGITITDENLAIKQIYFARVKTNANGSTPESKWVVSSGFSIRGEQIFSTIVDTEIKDKTAILHWRSTTGLTKIVLTPANGTPREVMLTATDVTANQIQLTNLTATTTYTAEIYAGTKSKGTVTFTTKEPSIFTYTITTAEDLVATVASAADGDVIGLEPGTYDATAANILIAGKNITIQSVSGNPNNTKILFKEVTFKGTGSGVKLSGIEFDGTTVADYFLNVDADPGNLKPIIVENSIIHNTNNCFIRANRSASNGGQKIDLIKVNNCIAYANGSGSYHYFMLDKLEFKRLEITNTTIYDAARALISWATNFTTVERPVILIDKATINSFGFGGRNNIILDANTNPVNFTMQNSIIANTPKPGQSVLGSALRANTTDSQIRFINNNYFNLNGGDPLTPLTFPDYVQMSNNKTVDLGWTATTTQFNLPANSELRTASTSGGAIGDPRWAL